jgi:predicted glycosyltransferase
VLVLRPIVSALRAQGHEVQITARDFAQTLGLLGRFRFDHTVVGRDRGGRLAAKGLGLVSRSTALVRWARPRGFDLALGHGSNDVSVAARLLRIPCSTMFDYEWATLQHTLNCRLAQAVVVPDAIPPDRLARYGAARKIAAYPGLKEEYYLADFEPDPAVLGEHGLDPAKPIAVVRTPPAVSLYHRFENDVIGGVLRRLRGQQVVVLPRTPRQRAELRDCGFVVPERAIDAQSLIAFADLVICAGGTMNREAVALGTPVWTTFQGRLGAVDERLLAEGRMRSLERAEDLVLAKRPRRAAHEDRTRRDPALLARLLARPAASSGIAEFSHHPCKRDATE